jgi:hypothetical protein
MVDHLEELARALHRAGGHRDASSRLLELAAVATMQAATLDAMRHEGPRPTPPGRVVAEPESARLAA